MNIWEKCNIRRLLIILVYIIAYWVVLPIALLYPAYALGLPLTDILNLPTFNLVLGVVLSAYAGCMLIVAIRQFIHIGTELPISAFPSKRVFQTGLYAAWRHPIYLFYTLFFFGLGFLCNSAGLLFVVMPVFVALEGVYIVWEERRLLRQFGDEYVFYRKSTPLVIPHVQTIIRPLFRFLCRRLFSYTIHHPERFPQSPPFFIVSNHRNYLDPFMIGTATTLPIHYVTTFEMFRKPIVGFIFRKLFCIPKKRYLSDSQATRDIVKVINERSVVLVFPEGERSWTGRFGTCKPQVLKLLKHYDQVPVVPIQIEGNYHAWPRWRPGVRKSHIFLNVGEPIIFQSEASMEQIDREIRRAIIPLDTNARCTSEDRVEGLEQVLYRCPRCGVLDSLHKKGGSILVCCQCSLDIELTPTYTLIFRAEKFPHLSSIPDVYDSIRIRSDDIRAIAVPSDLEHAMGRGKDEWLIAFSRQATYFVEDGMTLRRKGKRTLLVTNRHVIISGEHNSVEIPLDTISSVTIESNFKLQMYQQNPPQLHQLTFEHESALKWQDYLDETILSVCHRTINRT